MHNHTYTKFSVVKNSAARQAIKIFKSVAESVIKMKEFFMSSEQTKLFAEEILSEIEAFVLANQDEYEKFLKEEGYEEV